MAAAAFAANSFVFSALSVHLIPLLQRMGHTMRKVAGFAALIGPMQVVGRIGKMVFAKNVNPRLVGAMTFAIVPLALVTVVWTGAYVWAAIGFSLLYGLSNGIITIVRGALPQALLGAENYGVISGAMAGPALLFKAAGLLVVAAIMTALPSAGVIHPSLVVVASLTGALSGRHPIETRSVRPPECCSDLKSSRQRAKIKADRIDKYMNRSPQFRFVAALIALFSMLFMQLAVASYACPNMRMGQQGAATAMSADTSAMSADCKGMDMEQPSLCHAQDQVGNQSLDKPQLPSVQPFVSVGLVQAITIFDVFYAPFPSQPRPLYLTRATAPPLAIRNCCFRI